MKRTFLLYLVFLSSIVCSAKEVQVVDYGPFMEAMQECIKENWKTPSSSERLSCTLSFRIDQTQGLLRDSINFVQKSGDSDFDDLAFDALLQSNHKCFPALPSSSAKWLESEFTFSTDSNEE